MSAGGSRPQGTQGSIKHGVGWVGWGIRVADSWRGEWVGRPLQCTVRERAGMQYGAVICHACCTCVLSVQPNGRGRQAAITSLAHDPRLHKHAKSVKAHKLV